ncbi:MAG: hypothetical protein ACRC6U_10650 [Fusobacteriaceae bacterium]
MKNLKKKSVTIKCSSEERYIYDGINYNKDLPEGSYDLIEFFKTNIDSKEEEEITKILSETKTSENIKELLKLIDKFNSYIESKVEIE